MNFVLKEQSPCQSVLLAQTKPEGFSPRVLQPRKHKGKGIVPIITHAFVYILFQKQNFFNFQ